MFKIFAVLMLIGLSACQVPYPSNEKNAYLKSKNGPQLVIPEPLRKDEISSFYYLPDAEGNKTVSIKP